MTSTPARGDWDPPMLELELDPTADAPAVARAAIVGFCQDRGVSSSALARVMLLVSETVTNAVIHPDVQPAARIRMRAGVTGETIRVEIRDQGSGFTPRPRDPARRQGGYGLYLLDKEAMRWGVRHHEGNTVWFEVDSGASHEARSHQAERPERSAQPAAAIARGCREPAGGTKPGVPGSALGQERRERAETLRIHRFRRASVAAARMAWEAVCLQRRDSRRRTSW
jgi:anti-sigma regulatory factor (Ser/Thr protein kinase)